MHDWPLLLAVSVVLVVLAGALVRNSLAELEGYKKSVTELSVNRFRAFQDYQEMEAIFAGLISLAARDEDARRIVEKFQLEENNGLENAVHGSVPIENVLP